MKVGSSSVFTAYTNEQGFARNLRAFCPEGPAERQECCKAAVRLNMLGKMIKLE